MISLSSHVLDTTLGKPVANLPLHLISPDGTVTKAKTDGDGRCKLSRENGLEAGQYQLRFFTQEYLTTQHGQSFYPYVDIHFNMQANAGHYHVPLLLSPFGFSSYRGS